MSTTNSLSLNIIRPWLLKRGLIIVPLPPDPNALREAGRSTRRTTRQWLRAVANVAEGTLEPHDTDEV